jgi:hypothetical protein
MKSNFIKLGDGSKVTLNEFITWSNRKQQTRLRTKEEVELINQKISKVNSRRVITPKGEFTSISSAANALGINRDVLSNMLYNTAIPEYRFAIRKNKDELHEFNESREGKPKRITYTPIGQFSSNRKAIIELKVKAHVFEKLLISNPSEYYVRMSDGSSVPSKKRPLVLKKSIKPKIKTENKIRTYRSVITPKGEFLSIAEASKAHGISKGKILRLIYNIDINGYKFSNDIESDVKKYFSNDDNRVSRKVITPKGVFTTLKLAAKSFGISVAALKIKLYDININEFKFAKELERDKSKFFNGNDIKKKITLKGFRSVITPKGRFESISDASKAHGIGVDVIRRYVFNTAYPEFKYEKEEPRDKEKYFHKVIRKAFKKQTIFVRTPKGDFDSIKLAADAYGVDRHRMNRMVGSKSHPDFFKIEPNEMSKPLINTKSKKITVTPLGKFNSKVEAIMAHKISRDEFSKLMNENPKKYYFLEK